MKPRKGGGGMVARVPGGSELLFRGSGAAARRPSFPSALHPSGDELLALGLMVSSAGAVFFAVAVLSQGAVVGLLLVVLGGNIWAKGARRKGYLAALLGEERAVALRRMSIVDAMEWLTVGGGADGGGGLALLSAVPWVMWMAPSREEMAGVLATLPPATSQLLTRPGGFARMFLPPGVNRSLFGTAAPSISTGGPIPIPAGAQRGRHEPSQSPGPPQVELVWEGNSGGAGRATNTLNGAATLAEVGAAPAFEQTTPTGTTSSATTEAAGAGAVSTSALRRESSSSTQRRREVVLGEGGGAQVAGVHPEELVWRLARKRLADAARKQSRLGIVVLAALLAFPRKRGKVAAAVVLAFGLLGEGRSPLNSCTKILSRLLEPVLSYVQSRKSLLGSLSLAAGAVALLVSLRNARRTHLAIGSGRLGLYGRPGSF